MPKSRKRIVWDVTDERYDQIKELQAELQVASVSELLGKAIDYLGNDRGEHALLVTKDELRVIGISKKD